MKLITVLQSDSRWAVYVNGKFVRDDDNLRYSSTLCAFLATQGDALSVEILRMSEKWVERLDGGPLPVDLDSVKVKLPRPKST